MPGTRLTERERREIAAGLTGGLPYAEIARRLGRPTSTVTREVLRNGGPGGYHPYSAQLATRRRATVRRRSPPPALPTLDDAGEHADAVRECQDLFAAVFVQAGLPRMTARVLACLYTTDSGGLGASELAQRLRVSPASVSKAVTLLEAQNLVRRERVDRRDRYLVDNDVWYQSMVANARMTARLAVIARRGAAMLGPDTPAAIRLTGVAQFVDSISQSVQQAADRARDLLHGPDPGVPRGVGPG